MKSPDKKQYTLSPYATTEPKNWLKRDVEELSLGKFQHLSKKKHIHELQKELLDLLYNKKMFMGERAKSDEMLTIVIKREKAHYFDFLRDNTRWKTVGSWISKKGNLYKDEGNIMIQIQFLDTESEYIGIKLMDLLKEYNRKVVKEETLYARTEPVEESTLKLKEWRA